MRVPAQMRRQKEWVLPQHRFRMPAKKVARAEQTEEKWPRQRQPDTERYLLPIDRQTRRSSKTPEAARLAAVEIIARFPALQISIYDDVSKSRTLVDAP